jgi:hypothetical protein
MFTLKDVQTIHCSTLFNLERWIVCTPLSVNVFVTLTTQYHLEYHFKVLLKHPTLPVEVTFNRQCVLLHCDSSKHCICPLNKFVYALTVVNLFLKHPVYRQHNFETQK